jgi:hypothetical protein
MNGSIRRVSFAEGDFQELPGKICSNFTSINPFIHKENIKDILNMIQFSSVARMYQLTNIFKIYKDYNK